MAEPLHIEIHALRAVTHRGQYFARRYDPPHSRWLGAFHGFDGTLDVLSGTSWREVSAAMREHASAQPAHPAVLGWPAEESSHA